VKERSRKFFLTILEFAEDARATTFGKIVLALLLHARGSFHSQHQCHLVNINITYDEKKKYRTASERSQSGVITSTQPVDW
jgi:hypothetical protein